MKSSPIPERVRYLVDAYCTDGTNAKELRELETVLEGDERARRFFAAYCRMHAGLLFASRAEHAVRLAQGPTSPRPVAAVEHPVGVAVELPHQLDLESRTPNPPFPTLSTTHYPLPTSHFSVGSWAFSYMVATVIVCVMLLGFWVCEITHYQHIAEAPSQSAPSEAMPEMVFVGRITGMVDVKWSDDKNYLPPPDFAHVPLDRKYILSSGLLEISYDSGAKVILEGPCTYEVESSAGGYLALGKLTARIVERGEGRGARGEDVPHYPLSTIHYPLFSVRTPTAIVTDLGTEFGVEVKLGMGTEVHVFQGKVEAEWIGPAGASGQKVQLIEGKAAKFDRWGVVAASFVSQAQRFPSIVVLPRVPVNVAAHKLIVKCSGTFGDGGSRPGLDNIVALGMYRVRNVNNGMTDETVHGDAYWLGRHHTADQYFIIDLRHRFDVERIELMNTHNSVANDRGTEDFEIWAGDEIDRDCELIAPRLVLKGTLPCRFGAGAKIPFDVFSAAAGDFQPFRVRYVKFVAKTHYSKGEYGGCGLNEIRVFATTAGNKQRGISPASRQ